MRPEELKEILEKIAEELNDLLNVNAVISGEDISKVVSEKLGITNPYDIKIYHGVEVKE